MARANLDFTESKTGSADLKKVIFQLLKWPILVPIVPRLALLALTFCQPILLKRLLDYINNSDTESVNIGYGLIGAYFIVYVGLATTSATACIIDPVIFITDAAGWCSWSRRRSRCVTRTLAWYDI